MVKLRGQWTTEYAVRFTDHEGENIHIEYQAEREDAESNLAWWRDVQECADAHIVTRQAFHGEWQPLPESEPIK